MSVFYCLKPYYMKKLLLLLVTITSLSFFGQKDYSRYYNSWRLGLNIGGTWQTADYRSCWGMAGGFTLEKGFHENADNIFSFAVRGRYLAGNTYGMDYNRNYTILDNDAYNGKYDPKVKYTDTAGLARGYVFDNYKTTLYEGSLELQVTFNRLRERTHVILNLWGGIGITSYRAKSDLLDADGKLYDFSKIDSTGNKSKALNAYNAMIDKKYESYAYGSKNGNLLTFSPSAGIGLGYQFGPGFSMLLEYKVTFPQGTNADLLDGKFSNNHDFIGGNNDYYHYTGINFLFTLRGKKKTNTTEQTTYTNTVVPVNPVVTTPTETVTAPPTGSVVVTQPTEPKPVITFITPPVAGFTVNDAAYKISAQVLNVSSAGQLRFVFNGNAYTNFSFNPQTHILEFNSTLNPGSNAIQITANTNSGSASASTNVIYELPKPTGNPPVITFVTPAVCPANVQTRQYVVVAAVSNIPSKSNISVKVNNSPVNFSYDANSGQINLPLSLVNGPNTISINASTNFGSDAKTCTVTYVEPLQQTVPPPAISFINPQQSGSVVTASVFPVKAQVLNITSQTQASAYVNGTQVPLIYSSMLKQISFQANLTEGSNQITVYANNNYGEDNKVTTITYQPVPQGNPPVVSYVSPAAGTGTVTNALYNFKFLVLNMPSQNGIDVKLNGNTVAGFVFNPATHELSYSTNLSMGANQLVVTATNQFGTDVKTAAIVYQQPSRLKLAPVVAITNPATINASTFVSSYTFKATVKNVVNQADITVKYNGTTITNYVFDGSNISFPATLNSGANLFEVTAINSEGADSKSATVSLNQRIMPIPPEVNLINPATTINTASNVNYSFKLSVLHVAQSGIDVLFNGVPQTTYSFNPSTKELDFNTNLQVGNNTLIVKGTNQFGSDSKQITVEYVPQIAAIKRPPQVAFTNPAAGSSAISQANTYTYKANIVNLMDASGLAVKFNGVPTTAFAYSGTTLTYTATLNPGNNVLEITATNGDGSDTKSAIVIYKQRIVVTPPLVTILKPVNTPTVTAASYTLQFTAANVTKSQIEVFLNDTLISNFNFNSNQGDAAVNLERGENTIVVKATNTSGTVSKTEKIVYDPPRGSGDNGGSGKLKVCFDQDKDGIRETILINESELATYIANGATRGPCPPRNSPDTDTNNTVRTMVICFCENGNTAKCETKTILKAEWPAYEKLGATIGACPDKPATPVKNGITPRTIGRPNRGSTEGTEQQPGGKEQSEPK